MLRGEIDDPALSWHDVSCPELAVVLALARHEEYVTGRASCVVVEAHVIQHTGLVVLDSVGIAVVGNDFHYELACGELAKNQVPS